MAQGDLTGRQTEILTALGTHDGPDKQLAKTLGITEATLRSHFRQIADRLNLTVPQLRTEAIRRTITASSALHSADDDLRHSVPLAQAITDSLMVLEDLYQDVGRDDVPRLGIDPIDSFSWRLEPGSLQVISCADVEIRRRLLTQAAIWSHDDPLPIVIVSSFRAAPHVARDVLGAQASVSPYLLASGRLQSDQWSRIGKAFGHLERFPCWIIDDRWTGPDTVCVAYDEIRSAVDLPPFRAILVDGLAGPNEIGPTIADVHAIRQHTKCAVVVFCHPSVPLDAMAEYADLISTVNLLGDHDDDPSAEITMWSPTSRRRITRDLVVPRFDAPPEKPHRGRRIVGHAVDR